MRPVSRAIEASCDVTHKHLGLQRKVRLLGEFSNSAQPISSHRVLFFSKFFFFSFSYPIYNLRPSSHLSLLDVTQIRGHIADSSPPSPLRFVPCISIARGFQLFLPWSIRVELCLQWAPGVKKRQSIWPAGSKSHVACRHQLIPSVCRFLYFSPSNQKFSAFLVSYLFYYVPGTARPHLTF